MHQIKTRPNSYQKKWYMEEREAKQFALTIWEAVNEGYAYFEPYLSGRESLSVWNFLNAHLLKRVANKLRK